MTTTTPNLRPRPIGRSGRLWATDDFGAWWLSVAHLGRGVGWERLPNFNTENAEYLAFCEYHDL